jgi:NADH-quinone oxidoreductase subunit A
MVLSDYLGIFIYFGLMVLAGVVFVVVSHLFAVRVHNKDPYDWTKPYECGIRTEGHVLGRYPIHYYLVSILFVIFDVETVFFVPWAVVGQDFRAQPNLSLSFWLTEMLVFIIILLVGYAYILQRGVLEWGQEERSSMEVRR